MQRVGKTFSHRITFLPTKQLLMQILIYESADTYVESNIEDFASK